jgi:hypothetical protein
VCLMRLGDCASLAAQSLHVIWRLLTPPPPPIPPTPPPAAQEFNLIDERELAPLRELIDRMVR